jgi:orotate phosphoribosyltransferase
VDDRARLRTLIQQLCLIQGDFTLSTGVKSKFYFDCKRSTLDGEGLTLIAKEFIKEIEKLPVQPDAIGGLTMGADFMTAAVVVLSHLGRGSVMKGSIARKEAKQHGTRKKIENELPRGTKIVVVDDVITSGKSTLQACDDFEAEGYEVVGVLAIVDRESGGKENIQKRYKHVITLFTKSEFPEISTLPSNDFSPRVAARAH